MHYLIDGHNLIAKIPDIDLADPDDEIKLILRLRSWAAASKKRQATVIFDGGIPGGKNVKLSTSDVRVVFASAGQTADALLIGRIHKVKNPPEFTLVSSDNQIIEAARKRKMPTMQSEKFVLRLNRALPEEAPAPEEPLVSEAEVAEWLDIFGPEPETKPAPARKKGKPKAIKPPPPKPKRPLHEAKRAEDGLDDDEVSEWLDIFGHG